MRSYSNHSKNQELLGASGLSPNRAVAGVILAVALCGTLASAPVRAERLEMTPRASATLSFTDNAYLVETGETEDIIASVMLGFNIQGALPRLHSNLDYSYSYDRYNDSSNLDGGRHALSTTNTAELASNFLFLDFNASIRERELDRTTVRAATSRTYGGDQTRVTSLAISPYVQTIIGQEIALLARVHASSVSYGDTEVGTNGTSLGDREFVTGTLSLDNHGSSAPLTWGILGNIRKSDDERGSQEVLGSVFYRMSSTVRLIARVGYDQSDTNGDGNDNIDKEMWRVGADFRPNQRSSFRIEAGQRYDRTTFDAEASHEFRESLKLTAKMTHELITDAGQFVLNTGSFIYDEDGAFVGLDDVTSQLVDETYISRLGQISLSGQKGSTSYQFGLSYRDRNFEFSANDETIFRGNVRVRVFLTDRLGVYAAAMASDEDSDNLASEVDISRIAAGVSYTFWKSAAVSLEAVTQNYEYGTGVEIDENAVVLFVSKSW